MAYADLIKKIVDGKLSEEDYNAEIKAMREGYIPQSRFNEVNTAKKNAEELVTTLKTQMKQLQDSAGDEAKYKEEYTKLKKEFDALDKKHKGEIQALKKSTAIQAKIPTALEGYKVADVDDVLSRLDMDKIIVNDDGITGLKEQMEAMLTAKPHWFSKIEQQNTDQKQGQNQQQQNIKGLNVKQGDNSNLSELDQMSKMLDEAIGLC